MVNEVTRFKRICCVPLSVVFLFVLNADVLADVRLPRIFGSKMVLPRDMELPIWGASQTGYKLRYKKELEKFVLPIMLNNIDEARDVRLLAHVYAKYGGFADSVKPDLQIVWNQQFEDRIRTEVSNKKIKHLTSRSKVASAYKTADMVTAKMSNRVDTHGEDDYEKHLHLKFVAFVGERGVFPEEFGKRAGELGLVGIWLNLPD